MRKMAISNFTASGVMNRLLKPTGFKLVRDTSARRTRRAREVHFLHIGKNAGTAICSVLSGLNGQGTDIEFVKNPHSVRLRDLPPAAEYFFSIRNPVGRFVSAFYSRKRKGQPRVYFELSPDEEIAFKTFEHAAELAEELFSDGPGGRLAMGAMKSISHTSMNQIDWFDGAGNFLERRPPVHIIRQECSQKDLEALCAKLGCHMIETPLDAVSAHRNDYTDIPTLTERGRRNIERWYTQDTELYRVCDAWIEAQAMARDRA